MFHRPVTLLRRCASLAALLAVVAMAPWSAHAQQPNLIRGHEQQVQRNSHALGLCGGYPGASGFAYRRYIGDTFIQGNLLPLVADRGDFLAVMIGVTVGHYLAVWERPRSLSLMPSTTALRVVANASTFFSRDATFSEVADAATCVGVDCGGTGSSTTSTTTTTDITSGLGAGIGFEFGAITRHGFSFSLDLMLTATWDNDGFAWLVPIPYGAVMYSW